MDRLIDLFSHACAAKLVAAIADGADEDTLKTALSEFQGIVDAMMRALVEQAKAGGE
jgi:hypothetical protein